MIHVFKYITADNSDVLAGTDLDPMPGPGLLAIHAASSQADTLITIQAPGQPVARSINAVLHTGGTPDLQADAGVAIPVSGGKCSINVDIVTAATVGIDIVYVSSGEM